MGANPLINSSPEDQVVVYAPFEDVRFDIHP